MDTKKYWKSYEELENSPEFQQKAHDEFPEKLPLANTLSKAEKAKAPRRDFLKMLGFSTAAATIAASCEIPLRKAIPYVDKPEQILPSMPTYYASSFVNGKDFCSVLVKTREGRPIKVEGNDLSSITQGGTSARAQASVVSLYDNARLKTPKSNGAKVNWRQLDTEVSGKLRSASNAVLLTSTIASPSTQAVLDRFPRLKVVTYDACSNAGILEANEKSFGKRVMPSYLFDKAEVIVGIECDFLNTFGLTTRQTADYIKTRKVSAHHVTMSKHFQFESFVTSAGAAADYRASISPSQAGAVALELLKAVGGSANSSAQLDDYTKKTIKKAGAALKAARGKALVVSASNDVNVQLVVNAINDKLNSFGNTIDFSHPIMMSQGDDKAMNKLVDDMNSGRVDAVLINNVNPAYDYFEADKFVAGLKRVGTSISFSDREDETSEFCKYLAPANHYLESWGDVEPVKGTLNIIQPTIAPLFDTRSMEESLLAWSGYNKSYYDFMRERFSGNEEKWLNLLHDGSNAAVATKMSANHADDHAHHGSDHDHNDEHYDDHDHGHHGEGHAEGHQEEVNEYEIAAPAVVRFNGSALSSAQSAINNIKSGGVEVVLYESETMGDGRYANNPYLQEAPDAITKVCWDNVAVVSKKMAADNGWEDNDIIKISAGGKSVELPITVQPGLKSNVIAVALGYGRTKPGSEHCVTGQNLFPFVSFDGDTFNYVVTGATAEKVGSGYPLPQTQTHYSLNPEDVDAMGNHREIIKETSLKEYKEDHKSGNHSHVHMVDLYPGWDDQLKQGHHWGMAIDLNACIGCNACTVACNVENNIPIVGKNEVFRAHEMHWMRIDRYYSFDKENDPYGENPHVAFQPMMCQHCDNAPCENVCPVNATNHSSEGLNQMTYNRCIGTRYCANNCPYKVRRFNWYDYQGADSFYASSGATNDEFVLADNLSRMVLNPDVTVRSRGVIEKCSFCVQKIQVAKLEAKKGKKPLKDGDVKTACQAACATGAISFGDINDKNSETTKLKNDDRAYVLLEALNVKSSVSYLTKVRNIDEKLNEGEVKHGGHHDGHHDDGHGGDHGHHS